MKWRRWLFTALTILAWIVLGGILVWFLGHVSQAVVVLVLGAIIAAVIAPLITWLEHLIPRPLAIALIYLLVFAGLAILLYVLANILLDQMTSLIGYIQSVMDGRRNDPLFEMLKRFGFTLNRFQSFRQQIIAQLQNVINNLFPVLSNFFTLLLNTLLLALVSFYFLLSGPRITHWLRNETPCAVRQDIRFLLDTLEQVIGGNFRGLLLLATLISTLTGIGLSFLGVPYPLLLGVITFLLEFIPFVGFYITATVILLLALTQGWTTTLLALGFVMILQFLEGEVLGPRIIGKAVGINPIVAIAALLAGGQVYGIIGAFLATPIAGVLQAILVAYWEQWKHHHPDQFSQGEREEHQAMKEADDRPDAL
jgi:predicted PurR-regulated permease PerM